MSANHANISSTLTLSADNPDNLCNVDIIVTHNAISANSDNITSMTSFNSINIANNFNSDNAFNPDTCVKANADNAISSVDCVRVSAVSPAHAYALISDNLVS